MMRVTNKMMVNETIRNLNTNTLAMDKWNRQLSTGRILNRPSDNPAGLVKAMRLRTNIVEGEQYLRNIGEALNFMETTDSALDSMGNVLHRVRELTVKAANGTNDSGANAAIAVEIKELAEQLKILANTSYGTKRIFAGTNVTESPLADDGTDLTWNGNNAAFELEIAVGIKFRMNLTNAGTGSESMQNFFTDPNPDPPPAPPLAPGEIQLTTDNGIFGIMSRLEEDIRNGNLTEIGAALTTLDNKIENLLSARSTIGAKVNRLELQDSRLKNTQISFTDLLSKVEDADMAEVIMQLKMQENVFRATLGAGARIIQPTLIDFLR
ncbi:MAG: flagellar hook-associated protein FlgL [Syntrophomonadaceae bacterium]|nr:flagellar hook-associated protein FlgL [Syntrophomonadaceae bacterium]